MGHQVDLAQYNVFAPDGGGISISVVTATTC